MTKLASLTRRVREANLMRWAADSKIVDSDYRPIVVYHGAKSAFRSFQVGPRGLFGAGIYLTSCPLDASQYCDEQKIPMHLYVRMRRPYYTIADYDYGEMKYDLDTPAARLVEELYGEHAVQSAYEGQPDLCSQVSDLLVSFGHDGIVVDWGDGLRHYVVFDPRSIKSADKNCGIFAPNTSDIYL